MDKIVSEPLTGGAARAPSTRLHRYYAAERAPRRLNLRGARRLLSIKANAARDR
jgi:hypothetical protein